MRWTSILAILLVFLAVGLQAYGHDGWALLTMVGAVVAATLSQHEK